MADRSRRPGSTLVGLVAAVRMWQVFPFDLGDGWTVAFRIALVGGIVGSAIAIVVDAATFVRALPVGGELSIRPAPARKLARIRGGLPVEVRPVAESCCVHPQQRLT